MYSNDCYHTKINIFPLFSSKCSYKIKSAEDESDFQRSIWVEIKQYFHFDIILFLSLTFEKGPFFPVWSLLMLVTFLKNCPHLSAPSDCLAPKLAARPALRAHPTLASARQYWAAPTARWWGKPAWTPPPLAQGAWAALAVWAGAAARSTVKPQTSALTPWLPARPLASPCPPTLGPGLPVAHQPVAKTHWVARAWPVCTRALNPLMCRWPTMGPRSHEPAASSPPCLRGE